MALGFSIFVFSFFCIFSCSILRCIDVYDCYVISLHLTFYYEMFYFILSIVYFESHFAVVDTIVVRLVFAWLIMIVMYIHT